MCGISPCPILSSLKLYYKDGELSRKDVQGKASGVKIGWEKFPNDTIYAPILSNGYDPTLRFMDKREQVFYKLSHIFSPYIGSNVPGGLNEEFYKIAISQSPLSVEAEFRGNSKDVFFFSNVERAFGNIGMLDKMEVLGDPDIPLYLIDIMEEGLGYEQAIKKAYDNGATIDYISRLLSTGNLGKPQRPMPSRWAKTTAYSVCSKYLADKVKRLPLANEAAVYHNNYLGNDYVLITLARPWEFEMFERWLPNSLWTVGEEAPIYIHEHETYNGVSDQAMREGGSYYSGRLGVCELLMREGVQAACLVIYSPRPENSVPFGSGETMMGVKGASLVDRFEDDDDAVEVASSMTGIPRKVLNRLSMMLSQNTLNRWM